MDDKTKKGVDDEMEPTLAILYHLGVPKVEAVVSEDPVTKKPIECYEITFVARTSAQDVGSLFMAITGHKVRMSLVTTGGEL